MKKDFRPPWVYAGTRLISFAVIPGTLRYFRKLPGFTGILSQLLEYTQFSSMILEVESMCFRR